jgi:thiamine kinase-like enzyme
MRKLTNKPASPNKAASSNKPCTKQVKQRIQKLQRGNILTQQRKEAQDTPTKRPDEMWKDAQGAQKSHTKEKEIELYRRTGTHIIRYHCTLPHFSQWAMVKTFDDTE